MTIANRQWVGFALVAAMATVPIMACSSSSSSGASNSVTCGQNKCPNDPPQTAQGISICQQALAGPCAQPYQAYGNCVDTNGTCDSDGKLDNASINSCGSLIGPLTTCEQANSDAGTD